MGRPSRRLFCALGPVRPGIVLALRLWRLRAARRRSPAGAARARRPPGRPADRAAEHSRQSGAAHQIGFPVHWSPRGTLGLCGKAGIQLALVGLPPQRRSQAPPPAPPPRQVGALMARQRRSWAWTQGCCRAQALVCAAGRVR